MLLTLTPYICLAEIVQPDYSEDDIGSNYLAISEKINDPFEAINRKTFKFNQVFYNVVMNPINGLYTNIIPEYGRDRITSFTNNLNTPVYCINNILQGDFQGAFVTFWRFVINSTYGIGGLYDVAFETGLKDEREDFGRTMAVYGAKPGAYLIIPLIGPSSFRDLSGRLVNIAIDPFTYLMKTNQLIARNSIYYVDSYSQNKDLIDNVNKNSLDPYASLRSLYMQNREKDIDINKKTSKFISKGKKHD
jgi:phospholipid-binding lipoprotein MlaA